MATKKTLTPKSVEKPAPQGRGAVAGAAPAPKAKRAASKAVQAARARKTLPRAVGPAVVEEIFERFHAADPQPKGELEYVNPFTLLVAVVLSAQATDVGVNKATRPLFAVADTPQKILALGEDKVREAIKTIGLFRTKARNVIELSRQLIERFGGEVPAAREALESLPGVGRKTANVVLNIAFGQETMAVDTHLFRVSNRLRIAPGRTPLEVELGLMKRVPARFRLHAHHWLILHGRYTCKALRPECERCIVADLCTSPDKRT